MFARHAVINHTVKLFINLCVVQASIHNCEIVFCMLFYAMNLIVYTNVRVMLFCTFCLATLQSYIVVGRNHVHALFELLFHSHSLLQALEQRS